MHEAARRKAELRQSGPSLFIIHAGEDKEPFVRPLYKALLDQNLSEEDIFFDEVSISEGENIPDKIITTLASESLKLVTIVMSNHLLDKYWPRLEYEMSLFHQKKFHPIWLDQNTDNFEAFSRKVGNRFPLLKKTLAHRIQYDNIAEKITGVAVKIVQSLSEKCHPGR
ncbi:putative 2' cyclic ADP-D-ribose synthase TcpB [Branchiostoma floridae x Branchiostoma japonicum]